MYKLIALSIWKGRVLYNNAFFCFCWQIDTFIQPAYYASILNKTNFRKIMDVVQRTIYEHYRNLTFFIFNECQSLYTITPASTSGTNLNKGFGDTLHIQVYVGNNSHILTAYCV